MGRQKWLTPPSNVIHPKIAWSSNGSSPTQREKNTFDKKCDTPTPFYGSLIPYSGISDHNPERWHSYMVPKVTRHGSHESLTGVQILKRCPTPKYGTCSGESQLSQAPLTSDVTEQRELQFQFQEFRSSFGALKPFARVSRLPRHCRLGGLTPLSLLCGFHVPVLW